jgi:hypothetical protein
VTLIGAEGSKFAEEQSKLQEVKSGFANFYKPDAVVAMNAAAEIPEDKLPEIIEGIEQSQAKSEEMIQKSDDPEERKELLVELSKVWMEVSKLVVESGRLDMGVTVVGEGPFTVMAGGAVSDGARLQKIVEDVLQKAEDQEGISDIKLNASKHQGVTFHTLMVELPKEEDTKQAAALLGRKFPVIIGIGKNRGYVAAGEDGEEELKKLIGASAPKSGSAQTVPPMRASIALAPLLKAGATSNRNDLMMLTAASALEENGSDKVRFVVMPEESGVKFRIEAEEGVLGAAVTVGQLQLLRILAGGGGGF